MKNLILTVISTDIDLQVLDIYLQKDGILTPTDLGDINLPYDIDLQKGVIINGRGPIWLYTRLSYMCRSLPWIAVCDPRIGAIISYSNTDYYSIGHVIQPSIYSKYLPRHTVKTTEEKTASTDTDDESTLENASKTKEAKIIALVGSPNSGKSVFLSTLQKVLRSKLPPDFFHREFFILRACPDGEGNWYMEGDVELCKEIRYKNTFTSEFVQSICNSLAELRYTKSLLFVDCGGKIDEKNQRILNMCSHAIIVAKSNDDLMQWRGTMNICNLTILAEVNSVYDSCSSVQSLPGSIPLQIKLGKLERHGTPAIIPDELVSTIVSTMTT